MHSWTRAWNARRDAKYNMEQVFPRGRRGRKPGPKKPPMIPWNKSKAQIARQVLEGLGK